MNRDVKGNLLFLAGFLGVFFTALGAEIEKAPTWGDLASTVFLGKVVALVGTSLTLYLAGQVKRTTDRVRSWIDPR